MLLLDFNKFNKKTKKCINDIKSQQFSHMDYKLLIFAEKLKPAGSTSCSIAFTKSSVEYSSGSLNGGIKVT